MTGAALAGAFARLGAAPARVLAREERAAGPRHAAGARELAGRLPRLATEARRTAAAVAAGLHGRRRAGPGDGFWQFRPHVAGESAARVDWRRTARDGRATVREREWDAARTAWLWVDRSASMAFESSGAGAPKIDRAVVLALALADALVRGGERAGLLGLTPPLAARRVVERLCDALAVAGPEGEGLPAARAVPPRDEVVLIGDFVSPPAEVAARLRALAERGARGHLVLVSDPAEDAPPFVGETELTDPEGGPPLRIGDAGAFGAAYAARLDAHRAALRAAASSVGWTLHLHRTDRPAAEALLRLGLALGGAPAMGAA